MRNDTLLMLDQLQAELPYMDMEDDARNALIRLIDIIVDDEKKTRRGIPDTVKDEEVE